MILRKIIISRAQLNVIPLDERIFFVKVGHVLNELNTLQKVARFSAHHTGDSIETKGRNLYALFFVRILAGKLLEAWSALQRDFFGAKLSKTYEAQLDNEARQNLSKLKQYFNDRNLISQIRNNFAFHYSGSDKIAAQLEEASKEDTFEVLLAPEHGNCLYSMSDVIVNFALLDSIDPTDHEKALQKVLDEVFMVTRQFLDFFGECVLIILKQYIGSDSEDAKVGDAPLLDEVAIPYFVRP